jgi:hypothetical protein
MEDGVDFSTPSPAATNLPFRSMRFDAVDKIDNCDDTPEWSERMSDIEHVAIGANPFLLPFILPLKLSSLV